MRWTWQWLSTDETAQRRRRHKGYWYAVCVTVQWSPDDDTSVCLEPASLRALAPKIRMQDFVFSVSEEEPNGTTFHSVGRNCCPKRLLKHTQTHIRSKLGFSILLKDTSNKKSWETNPAKALFTTLLQPISLCPITEEKDWCCAAELDVKYVSL